MGLPKSPLSNEDGRIRPHELRAMSVLMHEQLLELGYRMTAVQFAEESESNGILDVDSWTHVGINLPKPPKLLCLLRSYWSGSEYLGGFYSQYSLREVGVQTDPWGEENSLADTYPFSGPDLEVSVCCCRRRCSVAFLLSSACNFFGRFSFFLFTEASHQLCRRWAYIYRYQLFVKW